jgi:hypothetical protein
MEDNCVRFDAARRRDARERLSIDDERAMTDDCAA